MTAQLTSFLIHWGMMSLSLWVASQIFSGMSFSNKSSLLVSALMLGFANALLRPILFLLGINALMIMLGSAVVKVFKISGFWTAFFASIFIAAFGFFLELLLPGSGPALIPATHTISV